MIRIRDRLIQFFYTQATTRKKYHGLITFLGGLFFTCAVFLVILLSLLTDRLLRLSVWPPAPLNLLVSVPLLTVGIWLWFWSFLTFLKSKGTPVPLSPPPKLVDTGPYAYSRNPMLCGVFLILFGVGFLSQSVSLVTVFTPLFIAVTFLEFKMIEEPELEKRLGASYLEYKKKVPMFFPYPGFKRHERIP